MPSPIKYQLILASQSPRRKELLGWLDIPFEILPSQIDEKSDQEDPTLLAEDIARDKGRDVWEQLQKKEIKDQNLSPFIVSSDTIVVKGQKVYGKPTDPQDAKRILKELENSQHEVITAVYLCFFDHQSHQLVERVFSEKTKVTFGAIDDDILDFYIKSKEPLDKAGAYGIQGKGLCFIQSVEGSYSNVVGFPLSRFHGELKAILGSKDDTEGEWRSYFHGA